MRKVSLVRCYFVLYDSALKIYHKWRLIRFAMNSPYTQMQNDIHVFVLFANKEKELEEKEK